MLGEEDKANRRTYLRSVSWTERSPRKSNTRPQLGGRGRPCFPPLPPLSITRQSAEEWPKAGSDDLGVWPNVQTPRGSVVPPDTCSSEHPVKEFEFKRDKLAFFEKECSRIADHIYLGSDAVAKNREKLKQNGITHVLNCVGFVCAEYFKSDFVYKTLWLQDSPTEDITSILYDVFDYFEDVREQGGRVFVHCCQGVSRSTSLVIAYIMWREGQSFEDAFQFVKTARGVTNPNMGFAFQLLQCQKRVHAVPASPKSELRMYRMAPHSPYDPLHLVPKLLENPSVEGLDSRGAFIVHVPSGLYAWRGKNCNSVMWNNARATAFQVVRYERAKGPIICIKEDEEPPEFWAALSGGQCSEEGGDDKMEVKKIAEDNISPVNVGGTQQRVVADYKLDFEIFHKALSGGVVPPFSVAGAESENCLPARENGWSRLRRKFANGNMKELITLSKLNSEATQRCHEPEMIVGTEFLSSPIKSSVSPTSLGGLQGLEDCSPSSSADVARVIDREAEHPYSLTGCLPIAIPQQCSPDTECHNSLTNPSLPTSETCSAQDLSDWYSCGSPNWISACKETERNTPLNDHMVSPTPYSSSNSSFCFPGRSPSFSSNSPTLSPVSDYSSSFTLSPSSSNWSDLSSQQPSPSMQESVDQLSSRNALLIDTNSYLLNKEIPTSPKDTFSANSALRAANIILTCKGASPSIAERRGSNPLLRMFLPLIDEPSQTSRKCSKSCTFYPPDEDDVVMKDANCDQGMKTEEQQGCSSTSSDQLPNRIE